MVHDTQASRHESYPLDGSEATAGLYSSPKYIQTERETKEWTLEQKSPRTKRKSMDSTESGVIQPTKTMFAPNPKTEVQPRPLWRIFHSFPNSPVPQTIHVTSADNGSDPSFLERLSVNYGSSTVLAGFRQSSNHIRASLQRSMQRLSILSLLNGCRQNTQNANSDASVGEIRAKGTQMRLPRPSFTGPGFPA